VLGKVNKAGAVPQALSIWFLYRVSCVANSRRAWYNRVAVATVASESVN
jgi:hypothetical protein